MSKKDKRSLERIKQKMAKHRDGLRDCLAELETLTEPLNLGIEDLENSIEALSTVV